MGRSISSNTNPKVPITFLYTAHMMGGYSFCHAYVYCHGKKPEEVWGFIEEHNTKATFWHPALVRGAL